MANHIQGVDIVRKRIHGWPLKMTFRSKPTTTTTETQTSAQPDYFCTVEDCHARTPGRHFTMCEEHSKRCATCDQLLSDARHLRVDKPCNACEQEGCTELVPSTWRFCDLHGVVYRGSPFPSPDGNPADRSVDGGAPASEITTDTSPCEPSSDAGAGADDGRMV